MTTPAPHTPPAAPLDDDAAAAARSRILLAAAWTSVLLLAAVAGLTAWSIHTFEDLNRTFRMPLSGAVQLLLDWRYAWCAFPLLALLAALHAQWRGRHSATYRARTALLLVALLALAFASAAGAYLLLSAQFFGRHVVD